MQKSQKPKKRLGNSISGSVIAIFTTLRIFAPHGAAVLPCLHRYKCLGEICFVANLCKPLIKHCHSALSYSRQPMIFHYLQPTCKPAFLKKVVNLSDGLLRAEEIKYLKLHKTYFSITRSQTKDSMGLSTWQCHSFRRAAGRVDVVEEQKGELVDSHLLRGL